MQHHYNQNKWCPIKARVTTKTIHTVRRVYLSTMTVLRIIGAARGTKGAMTPQIFRNIVMLCFERRFSKQNSITRLKSNILAPHKLFGPP